MFIGWSENTSAEHDKREVALLYWYMFGDALAEEEQVLLLGRIVLQ
mgnify:CR=1 FL=1